MSNTTAPSHHQLTGVHNCCLEGEYPALEGLVQATFYSDDATVNHTGLSTQWQPLGPYGGVAARSEWEPVRVLLGQDHQEHQGEENPDGGVAARDPSSPRSLRGLPKKHSEELRYVQNLFLSPLSSMAQMSTVGMLQLMTMNAPIVMVCIICSMVPGRGHGSGPSPHVSYLGNGCFGVGVGCWEPPFWGPEMEGYLPFAHWVHMVQWWCVTCPDDDSRKAGKILQRLTGEAFQLFTLRFPPGITMNGGIINGQPCSAVTFLLHALAEKLSLIHI